MFGPLLFADIGHCLKHAQRTTFRASAPARLLVPNTQSPASGGHLERCGSSPAGRAGVPAVRGSRGNKRRSSHPRMGRTESARKVQSSLKCIRASAVRRTAEQPKRILTSAFHPKRTLMVNAAIVLESILTA